MRPRYFIGDLDGHGLVAEAPFASLRYTKVLSAPGGWTASIADDHPDISGANRSRITPNERAVWVADGAELLFGGIIRDLGIDRDADEGGDKLTLGGDGLFGYFKGDGSDTGRFYRGAATTLTTDVEASVRFLLDYAQEVTDANGDLGLELAVTGPTVGHEDVELDPSEAPNIGATIERICTDAGAEFDTDYRWDTALEPWRPVPILSLATDRRGRELDLVLEHQVNVDVIRYNVAGLNQAHRVIGIGAGTLRRASYNAAVLAAAAPFIEGVATDTRIRSSARLLDAANRARIRRQAPARTCRVEVREDARDISPSTLITGDVVRLNYDDGALVEELTRFRIDQIEVSFDTDGATIAYELTAAELYVDDDPPEE